MPTAEAARWPTKTFSYGTQQALTANAFTREGYTFKGWAAL